MNLLCYCFKVALLLNLMFPSYMCCRRMWQMVLLLVDCLQKYFFCPFSCLACAMVGILVEYTNDGTRYSLVKASYSANRDFL
jgi:hypothetical protein